MTVNGTAVIYHTQSRRNQVPYSVFASINWHTLDETGNSYDGNNGIQQLSFDDPTSRPQNKGERSLLSLPGPPIQKTQGTVGDGKPNTSKEPSQRKETGNSYDYSTLLK